MHAKFYQVIVQRLWVINSALDFGHGLRSRISLERIKQSTIGKRRYRLRFSHVRWKQFGDLRSTNEKWPLPLTYDLEIHRIRAVVKVHVRAKFHKLQRFTSYRSKKTPTKTILSLNLLPRRDSKELIKKVLLWNTYGVLMMMMMMMMMMMVKISRVGSLLYRSTLYWVIYIICQTRQWISLGHI